jgi:glutaredoxin
MNIQIFGTSKCQDTRKAQRFFKERGIPFQYVDLAVKGLSKGELTVSRLPWGSKTSWIHGAAATSAKP